MCGYVLLQLSSGSKFTRLEDDFSLYVSVDRLRQSRTAGLASLQENPGLYFGLKA